MITTDAAPHRLLTPMLDELIAATESAVERLRLASAGGAGSSASAADRGKGQRVGHAEQQPEVDDEAVHDFRVALRRLRTLLKPARLVYGKRRMREAARDLRRFASTAGAVRDEEVLRETLSALELPPEARAALDVWTAHRAGHERARRAELVSLLLCAERLRSIEGVLSRLQRALHHPRVARRDAPRLDDLVDITLGKAIAAVQEFAEARATDVRQMHELRLHYKRLRYTAEFFAKVIGERASTLEKRAEKMQRRLGDLHDADEALAHIESASKLDAVTREAVVAALRERRGRLVERAARELPEALLALAGEPEGAPPSSLTAAD
jgi:CHAD domain-containing protein